MGEGACCCLVTNSRPTLCNPMDHQAPLSMGFSRQEYWGRLPFPSPGDLPDPGIEPKSPALQADSLPLNHQASQKDTVGCLNQISGNDGTKTVQELVSQMREEDILS